MRFVKSATSANAGTMSRGSKNKAISGIAIRPPPKPITELTRMARHCIKEMRIISYIASNAYPTDWAVWGNGIEKLMFLWDFPYNIAYPCSATPLGLFSNRISNLF